MENKSGCTRWGEWFFTDERTVVVKIPHKQNTRIKRLADDYRRLDEGIRTMREDPPSQLPSIVCSASIQGMKAVQDGMHQRVMENLSTLHLWFDLAEMSECRYRISPSQLDDLIANAYCSNRPAYRRAEETAEYTVPWRDNNDCQTVRLVEVDVTDTEVAIELSFD